MTNYRKQTNDSRRFYSNVADGTNALSLAVLLYVGVMAYKASRYRGGENLELMALMFVGFPLLFVQSLVFIPINLYCVGRLRLLSNPKPYFALILLIAISSPILTLACIVIGMHLAEIHTNKVQFMH